MNKPTLTDVLPFLPKLASSIVTVAFELVLNYCLYNYFIAVQLHLPTGTWLQIFAVMTLRNICIVPLITTARTLFTNLN